MSTQEERLAERERRNKLLAPFHEAYALAWREFYPTGMFVPPVFDYSYEALRVRAALSALQGAIDLLNEAKEG